MKNRNLFLRLILILAGISSASIVAAQDSEFKVDKINSKAVRISGAKNVVYSPSGKFAALQTSSNFLLLPAQNLGQSIENPANARFTRGQIIGFLPSETLIYCTDDGVFALDPLKLTSRKLFSQTAAQRLIENQPNEKAIVIASNDLLITGDGSYDWGGNKGNIYKFDLARKRVTKSAVIWDFWYSSLSPTGRFVLYEHGAENNNNTDLYDILQGKNYPISKYFNFKINFPKLKATDEVPIIWLRGRDRFLASVSPADDGENDPVKEEPDWLVLFDVPTRKILWKKPMDKRAFPTEYHQLDSNKLLVNFEDGIYELSLANGSLRKNSRLDGKQIAVSPNGKMVAFTKSNQVIIASPGGNNKKVILDLPADWKWQTAYKGMGERSPLWSADAKSLALFGENDVLVVKIDGNFTPGT